MRLTLLPGDDIAVLVRAARDDVESLVVVIVPGFDPLALAQAKAAIGPLAVELAPACRLNAIIAAENAAPDAVDSAIAFLEQARSTTGQLLDLA